MLLLFGSVRIDCWNHSKVGWVGGLLMKRDLTSEEWIKRGCQRRAVVDVLKRPMTASQILNSAKRMAPRIQLRDLWLILKQMGQRDLVICQNPGVGNGKLFYPSCRLRKLTGSDAGKLMRHADKYSWLCRGHLRLAVCLILWDSRYRHAKGLTPSEIRKVGGDAIRAGMNSVIRTVGELHTKGIVCSQTAGKRTCRRCFSLTQDGERLIGSAFDQERVLKSSSPETDC